MWIHTKHRTLPTLILTNPIKWGFATMEQERSIPLVNTHFQTPLVKGLNNWNFRKAMKDNWWGSIILQRTRSEKERNLRWQGAWKPSIWRKFSRSVNEIKVWNYRPKWVLFILERVYDKFLRYWDRVFWRAASACSARSSCSSALCWAFRNLELLTSC